MMKRDMDLVREILLISEHSDSINNYVINSDNYYKIDKFSNYTFDEISEHCSLIKEYKLANIQFNINGSISFEGLSWEGYDFFEKIKEQSIWNKIKKIIMEKGLILTIDTIMTITTKSFMESIKF